jgi:isopentenyl diphosphate isomerase/L-lactate dehydrogenase-like FMN-dependent dehydrogenase
MGVKSVYDRIADELTRSMTIAGVSAIKDIRRDSLVN